MMMTRLPTFLFAVPFAIAIAACGGDDKGADADAGPTAADAAPCASDLLIDLSGTVRAHPAAPANLDNTAEAVIALEEASQRLVGGQEILQSVGCIPASMPLSLAVDTATPWSFTDVNTRPIALGLIASVDDSGATDDYMLTVTGLANPPVDVDRNDFEAYVLTQDGVAELSTALGLDAGALGEDGFILGMFLDAAGVPVEGVSVINANTGQPIAAARYPNESLTGETGDGKTSPSGVFLITQAGLATYGGEGGGKTFETQQAAFLPKSAFVMFLHEI